MLVVFAVMLGATIYLYEIVPKGFIPDTDNDQLYINTEVAQGTSSKAGEQLQRRVARTLQADPDVDVFFSSMGGSMFGGTPTTGRMFVNLKPRRERALTAQQVADRLRPQLAAFPGIRVVVTLPQVIRIGGRGSRSAYEFTLQSPDTKQLYAEAAKFERE